MARSPTKRQQNKVARVMREFKNKKLTVGQSRKKVKSPKQAIAIALSEAGISRRNARTKSNAAKKSK